jgi:aspartyl-tRNA synthetase
MEALQTQQPLEVLAYQYDIVCNGLEPSSGVIRFPMNAQAEDVMMGMPGEVTLAQLHELHLSTLIDA